MITENEHAHRHVHPDMHTNRGDRDEKLCKVPGRCATQVDTAETHAQDGNNRHKIGLTERRKAKEQEESDWQTVGSPKKIVSHAGRVSCW